MSTPINDGGPAFPARPTEHLSNGMSITAHHGMTLRDYFAAKVMGYAVDHCTTYLRSAEEAYKIADAMIKARSA